MAKQEIVQTMEQKRAAYALEQVNAFCRKDKPRQVELRRHVNGLPAMIHMNGLGQALAFYRMKGGAHEEIYKVLSAWLCQKEGRVFREASADVLEAITRSDMHHYMAAQGEALALLEWLKKFALAFLQKDE